MTDFDSAEEDLRNLLSFWDEELLESGLHALSNTTLVAEAMGGTLEQWAVVDGVRESWDAMFDHLEHKGWAFRWLGRPWISAELRLPEGGPVGEPVCNYDLPPTTMRLRDPALYAYELDARPRAVGLVPGWMKVELAVVGAWDLRADAPTWDRNGPTGVPQSPESVGVPPPPGAEHAQAWEDVPEAGPRPGAGTPAVAVAPCVVETVEAWTAPAQVLDPGPFRAVAQAWARLACEHGAVVSLASPVAESEDDPGVLGVAPVLAEVVAVFPGVTVEPFAFDWPATADQAWEELGLRTTYQPVWASPGGREAIVVRIDPADGSAARWSG